MSAHCVFFIGTSLDQVLIHSLKTLNNLQAALGYHPSNLRSMYL
jgi:hypothetical protein